MNPREFGLDMRNPSAAPLGLQNGVRGVIPLGARDAETGLVFRYPRPAFDDLREAHVDFTPQYALEQDLWQLHVVHEADRATVTLNAGYQEWTRRRCV